MCELEADAERAALKAEVKGLKLKQEVEQQQQHQPSRASLVVESAVALKLKTIR
jgi:hypothetical protein